MLENIENFLLWVETFSQEIAQFYVNVKSFAIVFGVMLGIVLCIAIGIAVRWGEMTQKIDNLSEEIKQLNKYISGGN